MSDGQKVLKTKKIATLKYRKLNHTAKRKWLKNSSNWHIQSLKKLGKSSKAKLAILSFKS